MFDSTLIIADPRMEAQIENETDSKENNLIESKREMLLNAYGSVIPSPIRIRSDEGTIGTFMSQNNNQQNGKKYKMKSPALLTGPNPIDNKSKQTTRSNNHNNNDLGLGSSNVSSRWRKTMFWR